MDKKEQRNKRIKKEKYYIKIQKSNKERDKKDKKKQRKKVRKKMRKMVNKYSKKTAQVKKGPIQIIKKVDIDNQIQTS